LILENKENKRQKKNKQKTVKKKKEQKENKRNGCQFSFLKNLVKIAKVLRLEIYFL
jgi:hypothetical protein